MSIRSVSSVPLRFTTIALAALFLSGCDEVDQMADNAGKRPAHTGMVGVTTDDGTTTRQPKQAAPADANNQTATAPTPQPDPNAPTTLQPGQENDPNLKKAEAGVGKQGQDYGGGALMAPITTPVREYFGMRSLVNFDMIKHDLDIYHAINNRYPKDWDAFQKEIIEPGNRELPELRPGDRYVYNPKTGELLVSSGGQQK